MTDEKIRIALERMSPKPAIHCGEVIPIIGRNGAYVDAEFRDWVECPVCRNRVGYYNDYDAEDLQLQNFCDECGQALKEPEEDD